MDEHGGRYPSRRRLEPCRGMLPQDAAAGRRACACCFAVVGFLTPTSLRAATAGRTHTRGALQRSELGLYPGLLAAAPVAQNGVARLRRLAVVIRQLSLGQGQLHLYVWIRPRRMIWRASAAASISCACRAMLCTGHARVMHGPCHLHNHPHAARAMHAATVCSCWAASCACSRLRPTCR